MNEPSAEAKQAAEQRYGKELAESPLTVTAKRHFCEGYDAATAKLREENEELREELRDARAYEYKLSVMYDRAREQMEILSPPSEAEQQTEKEQ